MTWDLIDASAFENGWYGDPNDPPRIRASSRGAVEVAGTSVQESYVSRVGRQPLDPIFVLPEGCRPLSPYVYDVCVHGEGMVRGWRHTIDSHVRVPELLGERPSRDTDDVVACDGMCWSR